MSKLFSFGKGSSVDVSIVIPVYNEVGSIGTVLRESLKAVNELPQNCEIIVVNDRSDDGTVAVIKPFVEQDHVILADNQNAQGKGGALRTGFDRAKGKCLLMMDGDGSHQAADIRKLVQEQFKTNGLVIASRIYGGSQEYTRVRAFGNIFFTWLFGCLHGRYLSDALNGFKAFSVDIYRSFEYSARGYEIEIELLVNTLRLGRPITEVPSLELSRQAGQAKSKVVKDGLRFLWRIILEKLRKPKRRFN